MLLSKEFEGKNEKDCIRRAEEVLGLKQGQFSVEVLCRGKSGFFGGGEKARILVSYETENVGFGRLGPDGTGDETVDGNRRERSAPAARPEKRREPAADRPPAIPATPELIEQYKKDAAEFLGALFAQMGVEAVIGEGRHEEGKVYFTLESGQSALIIGKRGKTLEAMQMLVNIVAGRKTGTDLKCVIDIENYREKREVVLIDLARKVAEEVRRTRRVRSLEPMNPFERRLIHMALQNEQDIETRSEGEGVYRKVKVIPRRH